jgi:hypothetical protein
MSNAPESAIRLKSNTTEAMPRSPSGATGSFSISNNFELVRYVVGRKP